MIFVTIGTQEPFDRLIRAVDSIAVDFAEHKFIAQTSENGFRATNMETLSFVPPSEFKRLFTQSSFVISHAGMGTIISALQIKKPLIVMPRLARLGEHRNEHQIATARKMEALGYIYVANNAIELKQHMDHLIHHKFPEPLHQLGSYASEELLASISDFINE